VKEVTELRKLREARGESLTGMAKQLNIGVSRYYLIESGMRPATRELAEAIGQILQVSSGSIFLPVSFTVRKDG
jgi:transcriptional regulator with XRE-family HTH domain